MPRFKFSTMPAAERPYETCPLQRCFRDIHAAAQHIQAHTANFESAGRVMPGLEPGTAHL